jgi:hypothetical protein
MKKRGLHDDEERDLITAYESGEFKPVKDQQRRSKPQSKWPGVIYARMRASTFVSQPPTPRCSNGALRRNDFRIEA